MQRRSLADVPSAELVERHCSGDKDAATAIHDRFRDRLAALARSKISSRLATRVDEDEIAQSTLASFFANCAIEPPTLRETGDLWRLLASIAVNKIRRQAEHHCAAKRDVRQQAGPVDEIQALNRAPSVEDLAIVREELTRLLNSLDPLQRRAVEMRLAGQEIGEVARLLGPTERTVRRWLHLAERVLTTPERTSRRVPPRISVFTTPSHLRQSWIDYRDLLLEQQIAVGGVCRVYRAFHRTTGNRVAVKLMSRRSQGRAELQRAFLQEAEVVARFSHPSIVRMHGIGQMPRGAPFIVLDFVDAPNLQQLLERRAAISMRAIAHIAIQVSHAIDYAHQLGVIHGDLKPANVLMPDLTTPLVTDFGFSIRYRENIVDQTLGGTAGYLAPEQIDTSVGRIGPHTDVFGLGALLRALIADESGKSTGGHALQNLANRCLAPVPTERPKTARDVLDELRRLRLEMGD